MSWQEVPPMTYPSPAVPQGRRRWVRSLAWSAALVGLLSACGPTEQASTLPFDAEDVVRRARAGLSVTTVSPDLPVSGQLPPWAKETRPAVAAGNGMYLVAWTEEATGSSSAAHPNVLAVRVSAADGSLLDAQPLAIATSAHAEYGPAVAFDGTSFLVAWNQNEGGPTRIYARRVRGSDAALLGAPVLISHVSNPYGIDMNQEGPSLAFDGTKYLAVWKGWYFVGQLGYHGILGTWISPTTGQTYDPSGFPIAPHTSSWPKVAYSSGRFLVVWDSVYNSETPNVYAARIDSGSRAVLDQTPLPIATSSGYEEDPSIAAGGGQFLVTWSRGHFLEAMRVSTAGATSGLPIAIGSQSLAPATVGFDGADFQVAWQGTRDGARKLFSTRVTSAGTVPAGAELLLSEVDAAAFVGSSAVAATAPGHFVVAYTQGLPDRVKLRLVGQEEEQEEPCEAMGPTMVVNGGTELTFECGAPAYIDPGAQAWDGCGNPLQVHAYNSGQDSSGPGPNTSREGSYTVSYSAWDAQGRTVTASRTVLVEDQTPPTLVVAGPTHLTHTCGSMWQEPEILVAEDVCYGPLAHTVWRSGWVNGWAEGVYTMQYTLTDSGGNSAPPVTLTIEVVDCPW